MTHSDTLPPPGENPETVYKTRPEWLAGKLALAGVMALQLVSGTPLADGTSLAKVVPAVENDRTMFEGAVLGADPVTDAIVLSGDDLYPTVSALEVPGINAAFAEKLDAAELSPEGYQAFFAGINRDFLELAQSYDNFNPERVGIEQGGSELFNYHYMTFFQNAYDTNPALDGRGVEPIGEEMDVAQFVEFLANRGGVCCGINWVISRRGIVYQLAPLNAKLRHNGPDDFNKTGAEVEAVDYSSMTPKQLEQLVYLSLAVGINQRKVTPGQPITFVQGHGESRQAYLANGGSHKWGKRFDFGQPESAALRQLLDNFVRRNPEVFELTQPLS